MDCNREEALRAKEIADDKLENKDYDDAKKYALKAQTLSPALEGIQQMLTTIEVYVSAEQRVNGERDWYAVFGVNQSADDDAIKKKYRKLLLQLHPDKNKCSGAEGAFKLISEGWTLLSDKSKRYAYNQRRAGRVLQPRFPSRKAESTPARANAFPTPDFCPPAPPASMNRKVPAPRKTKAPPAPPVQRTDTFWTFCHRCRSHFEYVKVYLNRPLLCITCKEPFMASEVPRPSNFNHQKPKSVPEKDSSTNIPTATKSSRPSQPNLNSVRVPNFQKVPLSAKPSVGQSVGAKAADVVQKFQDNLKRAYMESHSSEEIKKKKQDEDCSHFKAKLMV